jgi:hypothetical protein
MTTSQVEREMTGRTNVIINPDSDSDDNDRGICI